MAIDIKVLVERAKKKEPQALETLYKMYLTKMVGVCIKVVKVDEDTALDIVHDAFILAFMSIHCLRKPERFGEWLTTIVRNVALRHIRRADAGRKISIDSLSQDDERLMDLAASTDSVVSQKDIYALVDLLPSGYGKVFRLSVIEGFSHKEIADMLGIEPHSSSSQLSRAKAMLRKYVKNRLSYTLIAIIAALATMHIFLFNEKVVHQKKSELVENKNGTKAPKGTTSASKNERKRDILCPTPQEGSTNSPLRHTFATQTTAGTSPNGAEEPDTLPAKHMENSIIHTEWRNKPQALAGYKLVTKTGMKRRRKWQLQTIGVLSPAVAQSIYKVLATNGLPDIGTEVPTLPEHISTWEDYSRYLHTQEHAGTPADSLALMKIADHNQGDIIEKEHHAPPIVFGISLNKNINDSWSIETGLQYSMLRSSFTMGNGGYYIGKKQKTHYLGIPIRLSYRLASYKAISTYGMVGLTPNIPLYGKTDSIYVVNGTTTLVERHRITPPWQWSTSLSLGLQYHFSQNVSLYIEPTLHWHIPNGSKIRTTWTARPLVFSWPLGIRFTW